MIRTAMLLLSSAIVVLGRRGLGAQPGRVLPKMMSFTAEGLRRGDFPILSVEPYPGKRLIYLDSSATSQKPTRVLEKMDSYYARSHSNVHRAGHALANRATSEFEGARDTVTKFINARSRDEVVFTRGATDAINLVAQSWGASLRPGDEIVLTTMEHHSNLVPWQMLAQRTGAVLRFAGLTADQQLDIGKLRALLSSNTRLVAVSYASNVLGVVNPVKEIIDAAHGVGAVVLLDACQALPCLPLDVQALGVDFLAASGHKMCGPTGIGFLFGKASLLQAMPPVQGGGEMIETVDLQSSTFAPPPLRFEAGTPAIAEAVGLGAACEYLTDIGMDAIATHTQALGAYLYAELAKRPDVQLLGPPPASSRRVGLVAFTHRRHHEADLAFFLDQEGVAVRCGSHCAQPLHRALGISGSVRASLSFYNDKRDVDDFLQIFDQVVAMLDSL